jgi:uncharacterized protein YbaA (DUF1428 family)
MEAKESSFPLLLSSLKDEIVVLSWIIYKIKNQQRSNKSFKHIIGVKRYSLKLLKDGKSME